jgi:hypothetical protein
MNSPLVLELWGSKRKVCGKKLDSRQGQATAHAHSNTGQYTTLNTPFAYTTLQSRGAHANYYQFLNSVSFEQRA